VVILSTDYKRYDSILKVMKSKLDPRMEYFFFDDNFHVINHSLLAGQLRPYRIRKVKLPYENWNSTKFWNE
jgi:hypothetical protein